MKLKPPYELRTVVADNIAAGDDGVPAYGDIYDDIEKLYADHPGCRSILFGFNIVDAGTGTIPDGLQDWYWDSDTAYRDYIRFIDAQTAPDRTASARTRNAGALEAARDELRRAAGLLQDVLDGRIYRLDACRDLGMTPRNIQYQITHRFRPYIKTRMEAVDDLCRSLERLRTPGDRLVLQIFGHEPNLHKKDELVLLPEYDEDVLWDAVYDTLSERERLVVQMDTGEWDDGRKSHEEIARYFHITVERVRNIRARAIRKLRRPAVISLVFPAVTSGYVDCVDSVMASAGKAFETYRFARDAYEKRNAAVSAATCCAAGFPPDEKDVRALEGRPDGRPQTVSLEDADLSVRTYNVLKRAGFLTLDELADKSAEDLMAVQNLGRNSLKEIGMKLMECLGVSRPELNF